MTKRTNIIVSLVAVALLCGCPWGRLDDLAAETPVQVLQTPDGFTSAGFGNYLVSLDRTSEDTPPTLVVGGQFTTPVAVLELGPDGTVANTRVAHVDVTDIVEQDDRMGNTVEAMAVLSDVGDDRRVLVGVPKHSYVRWIRIPPSDSSEPTLLTGGRFTVPEPVSWFGGAVAAGDLDGSGTQEWAIAENDNVFLMLDESEGEDYEVCPYVGPDQSGFSATTRALVAGRFSNTATTDTFAVGLPDPDDPFGTVRMIAWGGGPLCNAAIITPRDFDGSREEHYFGTALFATDLNGDGADDLIVGSPNRDEVPGSTSRVYVYLTSGTASASLMSTPSYVAEYETRNFGSTVSAMDLDGDDIPELVVGDPTTPHESGNRGRVHIFQANWTATSGTPVALESDVETVLGDTAEPTTMLGSDLKPETASFGTQLTGLGWTYGSLRRELVVGASENIFLFFLTGLAEDSDHASEIQDPR